MTLKKGKVDKSTDAVVAFEEDSNSTVVENTSPKEEVKKAEDLSNADLKQMVIDMQADIEKLSKSRATSEDEDEQDAIDDYQEDVSVFFCFSDWHGIYTDKRRGKEILPPNGPIKFDGVYRWRKRFGNDWKVVSVSQFSTHSKSEIEYLKKHTEFNIKFFENIDTVKNLDATFAQKHLEQHGIVSRMTDLGVIERSKTEGLAIRNGDLDELRRELTTALTNKAIEGDKAFTIKTRLQNDGTNPETRSIPSNLLAKGASPQQNVYD